MLEHGSSGCIPSGTSRGSVEARRTAGKLALCNVAYRPLRGGLYERRRFGRVANALGTRFRLPCLTKVDYSLYCPGGNRLRTGLRIEASLGILLAVRCDCIRFGHRLFAA